MVSPLRFFDPGRVFYPVGGPRLGSSRMDKLTAIFNQVLFPLYGSQEKALRQISESSDRRCFLLYDGDHPVGVLQFKTDPSNEFSEYGIKESIEIKSLFVYDSQANSGRGLGSLLFTKLIEETQKLGKEFSGYHVTVSEDKQESLDFFKRKGFKIVHTWANRYQEGKSEHLLFRAATCEGQSGALDPRGEPVGRGTYPDEPQLVHVIHNAHTDDIHCFLRMGARLVTGSKDNTLVMWDGQSHERLAIVADTEPDLASSDRWITDMERVNDALWMSARRNGDINLWTSSGEHVKHMRVKMPKGISAGTQKENAHRINRLCFDGDDQIPGFFTTMRCQFNHVDLISARTRTVTQVDPRDWAYDMSVLSKDHALVVVGGRIDAYRLVEDGWKKTGTPLKEAKKTVVESGGTKRFQRAFIQSMNPMPSSPYNVALAVLNGNVQRLDVAAERIVNTWEAHTGRVWSALPLTPQVIASCGEDKTVRIWDVRHKTQVYEIKSPIGPVQSMIQWDAHTLVTGTSPDGMLEGKCNAQIRTYDIRF